MKRVLEPQLMDDLAQAEAYAGADFSESDDMFVDRFVARFGDAVAGHVLDLGCGPGNIALRIARACPDTIVHAVDGSASMLQCAEAALREAPDIRDRVHLVHGLIQDALLPRKRYDVVVSNSLLHHLPDAAVLWRTIVRYARHGAPVQVMDLMRPADEARARELVRTYAGDAPDVLRQDFFNSLLAAFEPDEVRAQLAAAAVPEWRIDLVTDRHMVITGLAP